MDRDPNMFAIILAATFAFVVTIAALVRSRVVAKRREAVAAASTRMTEVERAAAAERRRRDQELEKGVLAGTHLSDGRLRCQASPTCQEAAVFPKPRVLRDDGVWDFVRRRFGASQRYRMVEPKVVAPGLFIQLWREIEAVWRTAGEHEHRLAPPRYCELHIHVARQVCLEQLSADEHAQASAQTERERGLSYFEDKGMEKRVVKLVTEIEAREMDKKRRKAPESERGTVLPFTRAANGGPSNAGASQ